jgi:hypothetical protein
MTSYEELQRRRKELLDVRTREKANIERINIDLREISRQLEGSKGLIKRIKGEHVQSRVYVPKIYFEELQNGMPHGDLEFPLETTQNGRVLVLKYAFGGKEDFYRFLGRLEGIKGAEKQKFKVPRITFKPNFDMWHPNNGWLVGNFDGGWDYEVFYLDNLTETPATLRAGQAVTYTSHSVKHQIMERVRIPGQYEFPGGGYQDPDGPWIPEHYEDKPTGKYETVKEWKRSEPFPMAILSAGNSKDLDNLEQKLSLVK